MTSPRPVLTLTTASVAVDVDIERGAEISALTDLRTGVNVLMTTPWAEEARTVRPVTLADDPADSERAWTASYAGGWQTLFPHAGPPAEVDGRARHYHGEASSIRWHLDESTTTSLDAHVELSTVPVRVDRRVEARGEAVSVTDTVRNLSTREVPFDYQSHPAFGAPFLDESCIVTLDAERYVPDPRIALGEFVPGEPLRWPLATGTSGITDLSTVPAPGSRSLRFGWLERFATSRATITNPRLRLAATLSWRGDVDRPVAWLWLDAGGQAAAPWRGRGYALAVEPSTRTTVGHEPAPRLRPGSAASFTTSIRLHPQS